MEKKSYEAFEEQIDHELKKRKGKWRLSSIAWMDYDDVCQIIRAHIFKKWDQWDQIRPLAPWVNKIITNQIKNLLRNHYQNYAKPCINCPFSSSSGIDDSCSFTVTQLQDSNCPLFKKWNKSKKYAYSVKLPLSIEDNLHKLTNHDPNYLHSIEDSIGKVNQILKEKLSEKQFFIYKILFIDRASEEEVAEILGYKTSEKGRKAGYKQIKNLKMKYKKMVIDIIDKNDILF